ncbi:MAG: hypothetical protein KUG81_04055 [Gammaproteobacteria bacterium]|nr:hypothetical protein [Gammaproteobacteria bacterium]
MPAKKTKQAKQTVAQLVTALKAQQASVTEEKNNEPVTMEEYEEFMARTFSYGKHKGETYGDVCASDPRYTAWFFGPKNEYVSNAGRSMYARIMQ